MKIKTSVYLAAVVVILATGAYFSLGVETDAVVLSQPLRTAQLGSIPSASPSQQPAPSVGTQALVFIPAEQAEGTQSKSARLDLVQGRRPLHRFNSEKLQEAAQTLEISGLTDPKEAIKKLGFLTERQKTDGRVFIDYSPYVIESKIIGDNINILLPQAGMTLKGTIESIEVNGDIIRWSGSFSDVNANSNRFTISQTMTDSYAIAVYETPFGAFNMEAKNGTGWVVSQATDFPHSPHDSLRPPGR